MKRPPPWDCYYCNGFYLSLWASSDMRKKRDDSLCDYHHKKQEAEERALANLVIDPKKLKLIARPSDRRVRRRNNGRRLHD